MTTSEKLLDVVSRHLSRVDDGVWRIPYGPPTRRFIEDLSASTTDHVVSLNPGNFPPGESMSKGAVWDERDLQRGIAHKTVVGSPRSFSTDDRQYCVWLKGLGADIRWNAAVSNRLILADSSVALMRTDQNDAQLRRHRGDQSWPARGLSGLFDALWMNSRPLEEGFLAEPSHDEVDRELLTLLAAGATDAQVARALDMSPRQVGRRIARLGIELGRGRPVRPRRGRAAPRLAELIAAGSGLAARGRQS